MKQEPDRLKVANSLNGQALKQVTTIASGSRCKEIIFHCESFCNPSKERKNVMDYKSEIIRMVTEINDNDVLMRIYHFILYKHRKITGKG